MHRFSTKKLAFFIFISLLTLSGCKKPNPTPEFSDPIFLDLRDRAKEHKKAAEDAQKQIETSKEALAAAEPRSVEKVTAERDLARHRKNHSLHTQKAKYYEIRAERRKVEGRRAYREAFEKGEEWPDPHEYEQYKTYMRLQEAPKEWGHRVPSMADRFRGQEPK